MSSDYLCRVSGESIQFVYNIHGRKGTIGCLESLRELTAGAEKNYPLTIVGEITRFPQNQAVTAEIEQ